MLKIILLFSILILSIHGQVNEEFESYLLELSNDFDIGQIVADSLNIQRVLLLDAREWEEYQVSRVGSAIWIGYDDFEISRLDHIDREKEIVVYCSVGYRSSKIAIILKQNGFKNVKNLYGGIFKWANNREPLYNDSGETLQIHTYNKHWGRYIDNPLLIKID